MADRLSAARRISISRRESHNQPHSADPAHCLAATSRPDEAQRFVAQIHKSVPCYRGEDYLAAFQFAPDAVALLRKGGRQIGLARDRSAAPSIRRRP